MHVPRFGNAHRLPCLSLAKEVSANQMDTQMIEIMGRNRLIDEIDLIAYVDLADQVTAFLACPIQMKAASGRSFSISRKHEKFANLIYAYVWGLSATEEAVTYALTYQEAVAVGDAMGYTVTPSWKAGAYSTQRPSKKLVALLEPHRMTPESWRQKILNLPSS